MIDRNVSVDFDVNGTQYGASMQQMIAVTQQYNSVADTTLGKLAKLGGTITTTLVNKTSALTQANKVATSQAAAYQQKMSGLEATAKVLGDKTFPKLEKATLKLAREFPIGIGQAVDQMEALQKSGVNSLDMMTKLSKTYTQLGAATGTYGPAIGDAMTEFTRSMGNNLSMAQGFGDTLTTLTKQYGGSAQSVLAFSKSIAPIASTIGINQAQVMGLSTAFSRLGEDGFAAGNALNKVMIDLNRASRDGGPELRAYANAMGKSVESLRTQLQDDPASVLVDFTEAINRSGPGAIRTLESLGIEGVRTVKAFTSLSREGNLGEILETAGKAYGSGSTAEAAQTALSGVNDQMSTLAETTNQMVANAGKPFLSWLETVLKAANGIAGSFNAIGASTFMQNAAKVGAVGGFAVEAGTTALTAASMYALARRGGRAFGRGRERYQAGRQAGWDINAGDATAYMDAPGGFLSGLGQTFAMMSGATGPNPYRGQGLRGAVRGGANVVKDLATFGMFATANDWSTAVGGPGYNTPGGQKLADAWSRAGEMRRGGDSFGAARTVGAAMREVAEESARTGKALGTTTAGLRNLGKASLTLGADLAGMGLGALGISTPMALVAGGAAAGYGAYKYAQNQNSDYQAGLASTSDPFRIFNDFAVKAGYATESITLLGKAASESAKDIADENDSRGDAFTLSTRERQFARAPGYEAALTTSGSTTADAWAMFLSNAGASSSQIARAGMDIESQTPGQGQAFLDAVKGIEKQTSNVGDLVGEAMKVSADERNWLSMETDSSRQIFEAANDYLVQRWSQTGERQGAEAGQRQKEADLEALWQRGFEAGPSLEAEKIAKTIAAQTGIDANKLYSKTEGMLGLSWESALTQAGGPQARELLDINARQGTALPEQTNEVLKQLRDAEAQFNLSTGATINLTDTLMAGNEIATKNGKSIEELDDTMLNNLSATEKAVVAAQQSPNDSAKVLAAGRALTSDLMKQTGGNTAQTSGALIAALAAAPNPETASILQAALGGMGTNLDVIKATYGQSTVQGIRTKIQTGQAAASIKLPENASEEAIAAVEAGRAQQAQGIQEMESLYKNYLVNVRNTMIAIERQDADMAKQRGRSMADFRQQQAWAEDDYQHSRWLSRKQFNTSMERSDDDYHKSRRRARRDFNKVMERNEEAYQRSLSRQTEDFNKSMERQAEDNAKAMYDPYKRVAYARVWDSRQLMTNLKQQNELLARQAKDVDRMKEMGLSQGAIDVLGLANPENAQQTAKMLGEMLNDPSIVAEMNKAIEGRFSIAKAFTTDEDNQAFRRQNEDFAKNLARQAEDFKISVDQSRADFNTQLADMAKDYRVSKERANEDFNLQMKEMARSFELQRERAQIQQKKMLGRMAADAATARDRVIADLSRSAADMYASLEDLADDTGEYVSKLPDKYRKPLASAMDTLGKDAADSLQKGMQKELDKNEVKVTVTPTLNEDKSVWDKIGEGWSKFWRKVSPWGGGGDEHGTDEPPYSGPASGVTKWTGGKGSAGAAWMQKGNWTWNGGRHNGVDVVGVGTGTMVHTSRSGRIIHSGWGGPEGGWAGNNVVQDIGNGTRLVFAHLSTNFANEDTVVGAGTGIGRTGNTGRSFGAHLHVSAVRGGTYVDPRRYLGEGGIATRPIDARIAEAGYPEMILPLNDRGAKMLAETMSRYLGQNDARGARVAPYSTMVVNNSTIHQDYSTNFTGPIAVEANDPNELARVMRQQARSKRLVQPMGGSR